jgi:antitoxin HicB
MNSPKVSDHSGSSFDSFVEEEGLLEQSEAIAIKRVIAWQLDRAMKQSQISKKHMAQRLGTSRTQVDRLLDPSYVGVSLDNVARAAHAVGKRVRVEIVDAGNRARRASTLRATRNRSVRPSKHNARRTRAVPA